MTRAELTDLFTPVYDEFTMVGYNSLDKQGPKVADVVVDSTQDFKLNTISGMGMFDQVDEDSDTGLDHLIIGYEESLTALKYRKYTYVTFEANEQNEYANLKRQIATVELFGKGAAGTEEQILATFLSGGFATTYAPDDLYLFYNTHYKNPEETGTTYDNLLSGAFSHDNLEAAESVIANNFFDLDGMPMAPYAGKPTLLFPPALRGAVQRVLSDRADLRPATTNNDINIYAGKYNMVEWDYIGAKLGGSDTAWYIIYPALKNLKLVKHSARPQTATWIDNIHQRYYFDCWLTGVAGAKDWRGLFGSTGS
jgi:hypothetical protein